MAGPGIGFEPSALVLVADPFTFPADEFLGWLAGAAPGCRSSAGTSRGPGAPEAPGLSLGDQLSPLGAQWACSSAPVWRPPLWCRRAAGPIGHPFTVTRSDRNVIYEVAGQPAMECLVEQIKSGLDPAEIAGIEAQRAVRGPPGGRTRRRTRAR